MGLKVATALARGSAGEAGESLATAVRNQLGDTQPALICVFASTAQPLAEVMKAVAEKFPAACVTGASTAGEFTQTEEAKGSACVFAVGGDVIAKGGFSSGLSHSPEAAVRDALSQLPATPDGFPFATAIMLLDPLTGRGEEATLLAATMLGEGVPLAGGAAGDDLAMRSTVVGLGNQVASDSVVLLKLFTKTPLGLGVCHGHRPLSPPLRVTKAEGSLVHEIDGRPAWQVWVEQAGAAATAQGLDPAALSEDEVGGFLLRYEAGLAAGRDFKIRAPLARTPSGALSFACGIPEGAELRITESVPERQIDSARAAAERALQALANRPVAGALVFDCICRNLILGERFQEAVQAMSTTLGGARLAGFETYGEIALEAGDMSGFHNTTTVVLAFPEA